MQLGVSVRTVHRLVAAGELDSYRIGRAVRIPAAAIEQLRNKPST